MGRKICLFFFKTDKSLGENRAVFRGGVLSFLKGVWFEIHVPIEPLGHPPTTQNLKMADVPGGPAPAVADAPAPVPAVPAVPVVVGRAPTITVTAPRRTIVVLYLKPILSHS